MNTAVLLFYAFSSLPGILTFRVRTHPTNGEVQQQEALASVRHEAPAVVRGSEALELRDGVKSAGVVLEDIAMVYVCGREEYHAPLQEAVLQHAPKGMIFKVKGKIPSNFVQALEAAFAAFPHVSWYYIADDDSFVRLSRLVSLANRYNASEYHYIGDRDGTGKPALRHCQRSDIHTGPSSRGWACGGPGILISRALARAMAERRCSNFYGKEPAPVVAGDVALACCARDVWSGFEVDVERGFNRGFGIHHPPPPDSFLDKDYAVSMHHLTPERLRKLGRLYNNSAG